MTIANNITKFFLLPSTITEQEKVEFEQKIAKKVGILDVDNNSIDSITDTYSKYIEHPTNGNFIYAIDGFFEKLAQSEKDSCKPSLNFSTATDDTLYECNESVILQYFPLEDIS